MASDNIKWGKIEFILFLNRMLSAAELKYQSTELEVAGLVQTIKKVYYIVTFTTQPPVVVFTDYSAALIIAS